MPDARSTCTFRPLVEADLHMLVEWLARPHVLEWWGGDDGALSLDQARQKYAPRMHPASPVKPQIAELGGRAIGFIQSYVALGSDEGWWLGETDPGTRGIDQFIADAYALGQGLGTRMVRDFICQLLTDPNVTKVQTDPDPKNTRAIRCYSKSGFVPVREVLTPDGPALLMIATRDSVARAQGAG